MNTYTFNFGDDTIEVCGNALEVVDTYTVISKDGNATFFAKTSDVRSIAVERPEPEDRVITVKLKAQVDDYIKDMKRAAEVTRDFASEALDKAKLHPIHKFNEPCQSETRPIWSAYINPCSCISCKDASNDR